MFGWFFQNFLFCKMLRKGAKKFYFFLILVSWHQILILVLVGVGQHPSFLLYPWHFWTNKLNSFCYDRCRTFSHPLTTTWSCYMSWSNRALHQISLVSESWHFASNSCSCWAPYYLYECATFPEFGRHSFTWSWISTKDCKDKKGTEKKLRTKFTNKALDDLFLGAQLLLAFFVWSFWRYFFLIY